MTHIADDRLVLLHYDELPADEAARIRAHLEVCRACRARERRLTDVLATVELPVPELPEKYETAVWSRLEPRLHETRPAAGWLAWRPLALAGTTVLAVATVVVLAVARLERARERQGDAGPRAAATATASSGPRDADASVRERILLGALDEYLTRVERMLVEITTAGLDDPAVLAAAQAEAADLVETNRLYRLTAASAGDATMASALEEIERALVEVARAPETARPREREGVVHRIEPESLIFKIRTTAHAVRARASVANEGGRSDSN